MQNVRIIESPGRPCCTENNPCRNCREMSDKVKDGLKKKVPSEKFKNKIIADIALAMHDNGGADTNSN